MFDLTYGGVSEVALSAASLVAPGPPIGVAGVAFGDASQPAGHRRAALGHAPVHLVVDNWGGPLSPPPVALLPDAAILPDVGVGGPGQVDGVRPDCHDHTVGAVLMFGEGVGRVNNDPLGQPCGLLPQQPRAQFLMPALLVVLLSAR